MAQLPQAFDATKVDPDTGFDPVPPGEYTLIATSSEMKETKNRDGHYLSMTMEIIDGQYKGRKIFTQFNINNRSQEAQRIAEQQLSALCHACGRLRISDSDELNGIPFIASVKIKTDPGYNPKNVIGAYKKPVVAETQRPSRPASTEPQDSPKAQPIVDANKKPIWAR